MKILKRVKGNAGRMFFTAKKIIKSMGPKVNIEQTELTLEKPLYLDNNKIKRLAELSKEESFRMPSNMTRKERHEWAKKMIEREFGSHG